MAFPQSLLPIKNELQLGESYAVSGSVGSKSDVFSGGQIYSLDTAAYDITGDIDVRIEVAPESWVPPVNYPLITKNKTFGLASSDYSWGFYLFTTGLLVFQWSNTGTFGGIHSVNSTTTVGAADGARLAVRATLDVNNGASGNTVTFYTSSSIDGTWTQLGSPVTNSGVTSIAASVANLEIGTTNDGSPGLQTNMSNMNGKIYAADVFNGIAGTRVASPRFTRSPKLTSLIHGTSSITDLDNNQWFISGSSFINREYVDVTNDTQRERISITRARPNEGSTSDTSECTFQLDNTSGNYSPRNPSSSYYGKISRNTGVRLSITESSGALILARPEFDYAYCYDTASLSITGDLDLRIEADMSQWYGEFITLIGKITLGDEQSYMWGVYDNGLPILYWSADGVNVFSAISTVPLPLPANGRKALRVTIDVNNGVGGHTTTFYTSDSISGTWTVLDTIVQTETTSIFDSATEVYIGGWGDFHGPAHRIIYKAEIRNGIGGSVVASPDFTAQTTGVRRFTDAQSNKWYLTGTSEITKQNYRFVGEIASWPQAWDKTGNDRYVSITAAGTLRRISQGTSPLKSTLYRGLSNRSEVVAYWPCEDGRDAEFISSGLTDGLPMFITAGAPDFAANSDFNCSEPLPQLKLSSWTGNVIDYPATGQVHLWFLMHIGTAVGSEQAIARIWCTGATAIIWQINVDTAGNMRLIGVNSAISLIADSGYIGFDINDRLVRVSLELRQNGANVDWVLLVLEVGQTNGTFLNGTLNSATLGKCGRVDINQGNAFDDTTIGHISVNKTVIGVFDLGAELNAYSGEVAADRFLRLCGEESIIANVIGDSNDTLAMGPQLPKNLDDLLRECETADGGILYEPRGFLGLSYRTRNSIYSQDVIGNNTLALSYSGGQLSKFEPVDDDQRTKNDVTANKVNGGIARRTLDDGSALAIGTIGRYNTSVDVNVETNGILPDIANWNLTLGTVDAARYPNIGIQLERQQFASNAALTADARALDVGDFISVSGLPSWLPPDDVTLIAQGFTEELHNFSNTIVVNCAPAAPWQAAIYNSTSSRYSSQGSYLTNDVTTNQTSMSITTPTGPVWSDADQPFDVRIEGEQLRVSAITGTSSPQTFTVARSINGVSQAHNKGTEVSLYRPVYYAIGRAVSIINDITAPPVTPPPDNPPPSTGTRISRSGGSLYRNGLRYKFAGANIPQVCGCEVGSFMPSPGQLDTYFAGCNAHSTSRLWVMPGMDLGKYDDVVASAASHSQYLLVTLFNSNSDCTSYTADSYGTPLNGTEQSWIEDVVGRHVGEVAIMGYECANESNEGNGNIGNWYNAVATAVKNIDPAVLVGSGGGNNSNNAGAIQGWGSGNNLDMLSYHGYYPGTGNVDRGPAFQQAAQALNKVWYAGERGYCCGGGDRGSQEANGQKLHEEFHDYLGDVGNEVGYQSGQDCSNCCGYIYWAARFIDSGENTSIHPISGGNGMFLALGSFDNSQWNGG